MSKFDNYSIPWDIMQMAQFNEQAIMLSYQEWIEVPPQNTNEYVRKFKHLVYMEEAAHLIKLKEYDLENVLIQPDFEHHCDNSSFYSNSSSDCYFPGYFTIF